MSKTPKKIVYRDSITGHSTTQKYAERHPDTTEKEHVPVVPPGDKDK